MSIPSFFLEALSQLCEFCPAEFFAVIQTHESIDTTMDGEMSDAVEALNAVSQSEKFIEYEGETNRYQEQ